MDADLGGDITGSVIGAAIEVHRELGPGLLESIYEECLTRELQHRGISYARQVTLPLIYKGSLIDSLYRIDLIVESSLIVEIKSAEHITSLHNAQLLTYLKLSRLQLGLIINFNTELLKHGIRRLALSSAHSAPLR